MYILAFADYESRVAGRGMKNSREMVMVMVVEKDQCREVVE